MYISSINPYKPFLRPSRLFSSPTFPPLEVAQDELRGLLHIATDALPGQKARQLRGRAFGEVHLALDIE